MVAMTKGAPIVDLPNSSNTTRSLAASSRLKYSTTLAQAASLRSSPGRKPSTSSGAGTRAAARVICRDVPLRCALVCKPNDENERERAMASRKLSARRGMRENLQEVDFIETEDNAGV